MIGQQLDIAIVMVFHRKMIPNFVVLLNSLWRFLCKKKHGRIPQINYPWTQCCVTCWKKKNTIIMTMKNVWFTVHNLFLCLSIFLVILLNVTNLSTKPTTILSTPELWSCNWFRSMIVITSNSMMTSTYIFGVDHH